MHQSFITYERMRYLKLSLLLAGASVAAYVLYQPVGPHNGGTWLGYALGGIGAFLVLLLMWLGMRKRVYSSRLGSLQGWVSAHVYLGLCLAVVATLHTGFQFGWNIHTVAYVLMMLVIGSGCVGVYAYVRYPQRITQTLGGLTRENMLREIGELEQECLNLAENLEPDIYKLLLGEIQNTLLGGTVWQQLTGAETKTGRLRSGLPLQRKEELKKAGVLEKDAVYDTTMYIIAERMSHLNDPAKAACLRRILELLGRRNALVKRLRRAIQDQAWLELWLYVHVPLSFALLAALIAHVVTVFLYW